MARIIGEYDPNYSKRVFQKMSKWGGEKLLFDYLDLDSDSLSNLHKNSDRQRIYISNHLSHADYFLTWMLFHKEKIKMPLIPAGDNLNLPLFKFLRMDFGRLGGFFIDRDLIKLKNGASFSHIRSFYPFIKEAIEDKNDFLVYPEGGRNYDNSTLDEFQFGLISIILKSKKDLDLVNIAIDYDQRIEEKYFDKLEKLKLKKLKAKQENNILLAEFYETKYLFCDGSAFLKRAVKKKFTCVGGAYMRIDKPVLVSDILSKSKSLEEKLKCLENYSKDKIISMREGIEKRIKPQHK